MFPQRPRGLTEFLPEILGQHCRVGGGERIEPAGRVPEQLLQRAAVGARSGDAIQQLDGLMLNLTRPRAPPGKVGVSRSR
ncbi:MAG: hypothetical protein DMF85_15330 [Acidobacteria bacterium]|nr:MAG: hypothetical protein DMF85_15330 [Acidobacteriota bacterium]